MVLVGAVAILALLMVLRGHVPPETAPRTISDWLAVTSDGSRPAKVTGEVVDKDDPSVRVEVLLNGIEVLVLSKADGRPLDGARIWVVDASGELLATRVAGPDGSAVLSPDASGEVIVVAQHPGYVPCRSEPIAYPARTSLVFRLDVGGTVLGRVLDNYGSPIAGARLLVRQRSSDRKAPAWTGAVELVSGPDGGFSVQGCGSGGYAIVATHDEYIAKVPVVRAVPGKPCVIQMQRAEVAVVEWRTKNGDAVFPRGDILLDGMLVDPGFALERAGYWGVPASGTGVLAVRLQAGQVLLLTGREGLKATSNGFVCRAWIAGYKPVEAVLRKWAIREVLEGHAVPDVVELEPDANRVGVHLHVVYSDNGKAVQGILPVSIHGLPDGGHYTGARLGLQRPGDAFVVLPKGSFEVRLGYPYQTLGRHKMDVDASPGETTDITISVNRGAELVLVPSQHSRPGTLVKLARETGSPSDFDYGVFAVRSMHPVTWSDLPPGRYRVCREGVMGAWVERV